MRKLLLALILTLTAADAIAETFAPAEPPAAVYAARRDRLMASLPRGAIAIINSAPPVSGNLDAFRQDSNFWYLTGFPEPQTIAVLHPGGTDGRRYTLYLQPRNASREIFTGAQTGIDGAKSRFAADLAFAHDEFEKRLQELLRDATSLWYLDAGDAKFRDTLIAAWSRRSQIETSSLPVYDMKATVAAMRLIKDAAEMALLRHAARLSVSAHRAAMPLAKAGNGEWTLRGAMTGACIAGGAARMAYPPVVGSGPNSVVLHYEAANRALGAGEMIVNDTACEYGLYAADVTRSYPVGGTFSAEQRALYELVLRAQQAGEHAAVAGAKLQAVNDATVEVIVEGLVSLGLLKGKPAEIIAARGYRHLYPHFSSHWLGLDVHDAGSYERERMAPGTPPDMRRFSPSNVKLAAGMAFTIEPGIYVPASAEGIDPKWWNIGIRIEDDYLMTAAGLECMSCALPRDIPGIEKLIRGR